MLSLYLFHRTSYINKTTLCTTYLWHPVSVRMRRERHYLSQRQDVLKILVAALLFFIRCNYLSFLLRPTFEREKVSFAAYSHKHTELNCIWRLSRLLPFHSVSSVDWETNQQKNIHTHTRIQTGVFRKAKKREKREGNLLSQYRKVGV